MDPLKANKIVTAVLGNTDPAVVAADKAIAQAKAAAKAKPAAGRAAAQPAAQPAYSGERSVFVGLAGGVVTQPGAKQWTVLYLDLALAAWLLVESDAIIHHMKAQDRLSADVIWDVIWVKASASVGRGSGPLSDAQFLTGDFVRAQDFPSTPVGGTFGPEVGVFQVGTTPYGCTRKSK